VAKRLLAILVLSVVAASTTQKATVHVRVEGKTRTLFAPAELTVTASTPMEAIEQASLIGEFYYHVTVSSFGSYVDQIGRYGGSASSGWVFKVDDASPPVGADAVQLKDGDHVLWYYADFGPTGGPPTLAVKAAAKKGCYTASAFDDAGNVSSRGDLSDVALNWMLWQARAAALRFGEIDPADREITEPILHDQSAALVRSSQKGDRRIDAPDGSILNNQQNDHARLGRQQRAATERLITRGDNWQHSIAIEVGVVDMAGYAQWLHDELGWQAIPA